MANNLRSISSSKPVGALCRFCTSVGGHSAPPKSAILNAAIPSTRRNYITSQPRNELAGQYQRAKNMSPAGRWSARNPNTSPLIPGTSASSRADQEKQKKGLEEIEKAERARAVERQQHRSWKTGEAYAPHDLSPEESRKWRRKTAPTMDAFDALGINPVDQYKNFSIMSEYISEMGRIKPRVETGLRPVNQRKIAKAIRRTIGLGLMPSVHRHPEVLNAEERRRAQRGGATLIPQEIDRVKRQRDNGRY